MNYKIIIAILVVLFIGLIMAARYRLGLDTIGGANSGTGTKTKKSETIEVGDHLRTKDAYCNVRTEPKVDKDTYIGKCEGAIGTVLHQIEGEDSLTWYEVQLDEPIIVKGGLLSKDKTYSTAYVRIDVVKKGE